MQVALPRGESPTQLLLAGEWTGGSSKETIEVLNPATEGLLSVVASATTHDGLAAVAAAHEAGADWAAQAPRSRADVLRRAYELIADESAYLARLIVLENGKSLADAKSEVAYAAEFFRWYSEEAVRNSGAVMTAPAGGSTIVVTHQPIGVSLLVTPWNFPAAMATRKIAPALAVGCSVILKPASETPLTALAIGDILQRAGVPSGVVSILPTADPEAFVSAVLADPRVRKLSFTGSTEVGRQLLHKGADKVLDCSMELGGNAPFIVFADADLDDAVQGAMVAKMRNGGQACTAANRFYVERSIVAEFTERLAHEMGRLVVGEGMAEGTDVGPLISRRAQQSIAEVVEMAVGLGSRLVTGGFPDSPGFFYRPTVLADVPADADLLRNEIFGPVAPIVTFDSGDDVVGLANDTHYGLVSYVYTNDLARAMRISELLEYGMVGVNRGIVSDPAAPFGGVKESGIGREGAHVGMLEFTESKYISVDWGS